MDVVEAVSISEVTYVLNMQTFLSVQRTFSLLSNHPVRIGKCDQGLGQVHPATQARH